MGRLRAKQDLDTLRNARITRSKARSAGEIQSIVSLAKSSRRVKRSVSGSATPVRRSDRLNGKSCEIACSSPQVGKDEAKIEESESPKNVEISKNLVVTYTTKSNKWTKKSSSSDLATPPRRSNRSMKETYEFDVSSPKEEIVDHSELTQERSIDSSKSEGEAITDEHVLGPSDYESIRNARISENMARLASLGLDRSIKELSDIIYTGKSGPKTSKRTYTKRKLDLTAPRRRSDRLNGMDVSPPLVSSIERHAVSEKVKRRLFSNSDRCGSKGRGSVYDKVLGICCHFCRQKKLCGEEDCKRCGDRDINQPCIGKTKCSECHSTNGVLCRACLKIRYGEEMEEVREKNDWMCPHCIEEKGINPYWICNSSLCLKKRKMVPTGIAIFQARKEGYESVAHMVMDKLKCKSGCC